MANREQNSEKTYEFVEIIKKIQTIYEHNSFYQNLRNYVWVLSRARKTCTVKHFGLFLSLGVEFSVHIGK